MNGALIVAQLGKRNKIGFACIAGMSYNLVLRWSWRPARCAASQ